MDVSESLNLAIRDGADGVDHSGQVVAAVSISAPTQRFPREQIALYGQKVAAAARAISAELGYMNIRTQK